MDIPKTSTKHEIEEWSRFIDILRYLRSEKGCPWDKEQTVASLRPHIIEEPTELLEAIGLVLDAPSEEHHELLKEEMGDVFLVLVMMMIIYGQDYQQEESLAEIIKNVNDKLIRRHPHVFGDIDIEHKDQLATQWNKIKTEQEGKKKVDLNQYKNYMHVLERTKEVQKRMSRDHDKLNESLAHKITQLAYMIQSLSALEEDLPPQESYAPAPDHIEKALGEALFSLIDIARNFKVSPTSALERKLAFELNKFK